MRTVVGAAVFRQRSGNAQQRRADLYRPQAPVRTECGCSDLAAIRTSAVTYLRAAETPTERARRAETAKQCARSLAGYKPPTFIRSPNDDADNRNWPAIGFSQVSLLYFRLTDRNPITSEVPTDTAAVKENKDS